MVLLTGTVGVCGGIKLQVDSQQDWEAVPDSWGWGCCAWAKVVPAVVWGPYTALQQGGGMRGKGGNRLRNGDADTSLNKKITFRKLSTVSCL